MNINIPAGYDENGVRNGVGDWEDREELIERIIDYAEAGVYAQTKNGKKIFIPKYEQEELFMVLEEELN